VKIRGSIAEVEYLGWEELQIQMLWGDLGTQRQDAQMAKNEGI
jgi:hypothetical protein